MPVLPVNYGELRHNCSRTGPVPNKRVNLTRSQVRHTGSARLASYARNVRHGEHHRRSGGSVVEADVLELSDEELASAQQVQVRAQRAALLDLRRDGMISEDVFEKLTAEVDGQLSEGFSGVPEDSAPRTQFIEVTLAANSAAVGQRVVVLALPRTAVLVSIRRGEEVIIPCGAAGATGARIRFHPPKQAHCWSRYRLPHWLLD